MILISPREEDELAKFAEEAAKYFARTSGCYSCAAGDPTSGGLLAIRWNDFSVLVVRLADHEPRIYPTDQLGVGTLPPLHRKTTKPN